MLGENVAEKETGGESNLESSKDSMKEETSVDAIDHATDEKPKTRLWKPRKNKSKKSKSKKKKIIIIVVILAIIAAIVGLKLAAPDKPEGLAVTTGTAKKMDIEQVVKIKGVIEGAEKADIASAVNYEVVTIHVKEGDKVSKGQVLATLDGGDSQANYDKAVKTLEQSKFQYDAAQSLYSQGAISREELLKAKIAYENDNITVSSFKGLEDTKVVSPISGTVTRVNTSLGRAANDTKDKEAMFVVEDLANLKMNVKVSEYDISKIQVGQAVTITADIMGTGSVSGVVSKISPTGEAKDSTSKEMVVPVTIDVNKGNSNLIAGVSANAKILIVKKTDVLTVPIDAVVGNPGQKNYVYTVKNNKLVKTPVILGIEGTLDVEVSSDKLKAGDKVVLSPTYQMKDGTVVNPMPQ